MKLIDAKILPITPEIGKELEIKLKDDEAKLKCIGIHRHIIVNSEKRTIRCDECGCTVDPFDYLERWAREGDRRMQALKVISIKTNVTAAECRDLERKVKNLRQRLKRAGFPQPSVERNEYDSMRWNPTAQKTTNFLESSTAA